MPAGGVKTREHVFAFVVQYKREHDGLSPTISEIADACYLHPSTARYHLTRLELEGRIRITGRRGIEVIGGAWEPPGEDGTEPDS